MLDLSNRVALILGTIIILIAALSFVFARPISLLWDRCLKRFSWLPNSAEGQALNLDCQGRSNGADGGFDQRVTDPAASAVEDFTPEGDEPERVHEGNEDRGYDPDPNRVGGLVALQQRIWAS